MEIDITRFFKEAEPFNYSASGAEMGDNAAQITWNNALKDASKFTPLQTEEEKAAFRDHVRDFGAWEDEEIDSWDDDELNALFIQMVSGDIREAENLCWDDDLDGIDWNLYEEESQNGRIAGRIFPDITGEKFYYYIGC